MGRSVLSALTWATQSGAPYVFDVIYVPARLFKMCDRLESLLKGVQAVSFLKDYLVQIGYGEGDALFGFGWDWRSSVRARGTHD